MFQIVANMQAVTLVLVTPVPRGAHWLIRKQVHSGDPLQLGKACHWSPCPPARAQSPCPGVYTHTHMPGIDRAAAMLDWPKQRPKGIVVVVCLVLVVVEYAQ